MTASIITILWIFCCAAMAGDAATTIVGLRRGWEETNPIMPHNPAGVIALLLSLLILATLVYIACDRSQDAWLALATLGVVGVIKLYCAVKNAVRLWGH